MTTGYAVYKKGVLHFDEKAWSIITKIAKKQHKSPHSLVISALKRHLRMRDK